MVGGCGLGSRWVGLVTIAYANVVGVRSVVLVKMDRACDVYCGDCSLGVDVMLGGACNEFIIIMTHE